MASRTYIEDTPFYPSIKDNPEWNTLFKDGVPMMNAYIATTAKQRALSSLISEKEDPVLAEWQYGMGTTAAFTSDISGKWSGSWPAWDKWGTFLNQLITNTLPKFESEPYMLTQENSSDETMIKLESSTQNHLPISVNVISETGEKVDANTKPIAPGKHEIIMPKQPGTYFLSVEQDTDDGGTNLYQTGFSVPYSDEYLQQGLNKKLIEELLSVSGGQELKDESQAFRPLQTKARQEQSISSWLLLAAFLLLFCEIAVRRFGWHRVSHVFSGIREKPENISIKQDERVKKRRKEKQTVLKEEETKKEHPTIERNKGTMPARRHNNEPVNKLSQLEREEQMKRLIEARKRKK